MAKQSRPKNPISLGTPLERQVVDACTVEVAGFIRMIGGYKSLYSGVTLELQFLFLFPIGELVTVSPLPDELYS
jgi:hypothetical protein